MFNLILVNLLIKIKYSFLNNLQKLLNIQSNYSPLRIIKPLKIMTWTNFLKLCWLHNNLGKKIR